MVHISQTHHSNILRRSIQVSFLKLSYSQKKKDLSRLAHDYILGSDVNIRVVVGIDVDYKGSKKASVSILRP